MDAQAKAINDAAVCAPYRVIDRPGGEGWVIVGPNGYEGYDTSFGGALERAEAMNRDSGAVTNQAAMLDEGRAQCLLAGARAVSLLRTMLRQREIEAPMQPTVLEIVQMHEAGMAQRRRATGGA